MVFQKKDMFRLNFNKGVTLFKSISVVCLGQPAVFSRKVKFKLKVCCRAGNFPCEIVQVREATGFTHLGMLRGPELLPG